MFKHFARGFSSGPRIYNNIVETIGSTPIVRINKLLSPNSNKKNINLYAKCEFFNPLSSVKDRLAIAIIEDAEQRGLLDPNDASNYTVIEATSGNTGIALAMVCAQRGYSFVATMAETFSIERRKIMRALGAKVILTPAKEGGVGLYKKAQELAIEHDWFLASQFENDANPRYHANTTGPEILSAFAQNGASLDYFVSGYGTGGTFSGAGRVLKTARPNMKIILSEPSNAPLIKSGIKQDRDPNTGIALSAHSAFTPHPIQGWTPNFIPKIAQEGYSTYNLVDEIVTVTGDEAMKTSLDLARFEGIFTGISGGATMASALEICNRDDIKEGSGVLAMLPDTMERYMSTPLFASIPAEMNEEELKISHSTPNHQLE